MEYYNRVKSDWSYNNTYSITILFQNYSRYVDTYEDIFVSSYEMAHKELAIFPNSGTLNLDHSLILNDNFDFYNTSNSAGDSYSVVNTIKSETRAGRPVMFTVTNHAMVAAGYRQYTVRYTEVTGPFWNRQTVTRYETVYALVVNSGWHTGTFEYYLSTDIPDFGLNYLANPITES
jgi:hypothetical protein